MKDNTILICTLETRQKQEKMYQLGEMFPGVPKATLEATLSRSAWKVDTAAHELLEVSNKVCFMYLGQSSN